MWAPEGRQRFSVMGADTMATRSRQTGLTEPFVAACQAKALGSSIRGDDGALRGPSVDGGLTAFGPCACRLRFALGPACKIAVFWLS
jgi:hypothetical protein